MLTTTDNPFDPYTEYDQWRQWDEDKGYFTESYLARIANVQVDMEEQEATILIDEAKEQIINNNVLGIYKLV